MWSSRLRWYTNSGWPRTASQVSGRRPWNHSSHSRSGGSRAVCILQAAVTLNQGYNVYSPANPAS